MFNLVHIFIPHCEFSNIYKKSKPKQEQGANIKNYIDATLSEVNTYKAFFGTLSAMGGLILFACLSNVH